MRVLIFVAAMMLSACTAQTPAQAQDRVERLWPEGVSAEVHNYSRGGHAFNMGDRSELASISNWSGRLQNWLSDSGFLEKP